MSNKLLKSLQAQKKQTEQVKLTIYGSLGIFLGGQKIVQVADRQGYVYVRLRDNQNEVIQAFNNKVAASYDLPVIVVREGSRYIVQQFNSQRYLNNAQNAAPFLPNHGTQHSFPRGGGADITWVYPQQFMPALVYPSPTTGTNVYIDRYPLYTPDNRWIYAGGTGTQNILQYLPTTGSSSLMVLVYMDAYTGNPGILVGSGTYFPANVSGSIYQYIPSPSVNQIPLAGVLLNTGTLSIAWSNIYDVRQWVHATPSGTSSGGGGGVDQIGIFGKNNGVSLATGTILNVAGSRLTLSASGTTLLLTNSPDPYDNIGFYGMSGTTGIGTGTTLVVTNYLGLSATGTFLYLNPSIGTGTFQLASGNRGVTNGDAHDHNGGDGGTISYPNLSNKPIAEVNDNDIFRCGSPGGVSAFAGTIATLPGGAVLTYTVTSGQEAAMVPLATTQLAKMRLYNTTRGTSALISNCDTATNTLTLTANVPAGWVVTDVITIASQTVTGGGVSWVDLEITSGPTSKSYLFVKMIISSNVVGDAMRIHPFDASHGSSKYDVLFTLTALQNTNGFGLIKITSNVFSLSWTGTPSVVVIREAGYLE